MYADDYRALAESPWWKFWLHRQRSRAIATLLVKYLETKTELINLQFVKHWEDKAKTDVINFLASKIK